MTPQRLLSQDILGAQTRHGGEPRQGRKHTGVWIAGLTTCALIAALAGLLGTRALLPAS